MRTLILIVSLFLLTSAYFKQADFVSEQKKYSRVKTAYQEKEENIKSTLKKINLDFNNLNILLVAYKDEQVIDLYAKNKSDINYKKLVTYPICARSGQLGPKRMQGDSQVPEGFYYINKFNPSSSYYLSLGVSYPNEADIKKSKAKDLGGDIFIHGECVTIGCMPMTNEKIKEIYIYALQAKNSGQTKIPVYVFPFEMTNNKMETYKNKYQNQTELISFWNNLKQGYDSFIKEPKELKLIVDKNGDYKYN
jgi:murein L,D-transpeptidase YafK